MQHDLIEPSKALGKLKRRDMQQNATAVKEVTIGGIGLKLCDNSPKIESFMNWCMELDV